MVEFALILLPLLLIVAGIIQFGIGLNFWLDQQRIANQGARWAVVNAWPGCARNAPIYTSGGCTAEPGLSGCDPAVANPTLEQNLLCQAISKGLRNALSVSVCYPDDGDTNTDPGIAGTPVRVRLDADYEWLPIIADAVGLPALHLHGDATMRLEQTATHLDPATPPCS
jgi:hypothetical protein